MVDGFDSSSTNLIIKNGLVKLSTAAPQYNRVPQAAITLNTSFIFPDMVKGYNYYYTNYTAQPSGLIGESCIVGQKLIGQEWGPPALGFSTHPLADVDIGVAVPDGCDYLDVQASITRTQSPTDSSWPSSPPYYGALAWPIEFPQGNTLQLTDAALVVERQHGFSRMFWFEIVSGRILLRRKQSVTSVDSFGAVTSTDGQIGFECGFINQGSSSMEKHQLPTSGALGPTHANDGTACSTGATINVTSVYTGTFKIVPCCSV